MDARRQPSHQPLGTSSGVVPLCFFHNVRPLLFSQVCGTEMRKRESFSFHLGHFKCDAIGWWAIGLGCFAVCKSKTVHLIKHRVGLLENHSNCLAQVLNIFSLTPGFLEGLRTQKTCLPTARPTFHKETPPFG